MLVVVGWILRTLGFLSRWQLIFQVFAFSVKTHSLYKQKRALAADQEADSLFCSGPTVQLWSGLWSY